MVVFTCNHCGESLQKPKVEKHYSFVCRTAEFVTCVDCFKDFRGKEYIAHTKCVTEEERYSARGSLPNGVVKKGEMKQESWVEMVKSILVKETNLKPSHKSLLDTVAACANIPRKKIKFINFIKSSSGGRVNLNDIEAVWNLIEKYKTQSKPAQIKQEKEQNNNKRKNDEKIESEAKKVKTEETESEVTKFNFQEKILKVLTSKGSISSAKLQKKVINAYLKHSGESEVRPKTIKKYNKHLKKIPNIVITDDSIVLADN